MFLSAMTTSVAKLAREREGYSDAVVVSTALVAISLSTAIVGLMLMVVGRCAFSLSNSIGLPMFLRGPIALRSLRSRCALRLCA